MHPLPDSDRFESSGEESGEVGDIKSAAETKQLYKELIARANSVPIAKIFKYYGLRLSDQNKKISCPFSAKHKNGRDNTPSFQYYPDTNSFWCHGCKTGTRCCDLVANMENTNRFHAANKILELYASDVTDDAEFDYGINTSERLEILMELSDATREIMQSNPSASTLKSLNNTLLGFDNIYSKHKLDNTALKRLVDRALEKIRK